MNTGDVSWERLWRTKSPDELELVRKRKGGSDPTCRIPAVTAPFRGRPDGRAGRSSLLERTSILVSWMGRSLRLHSWRSCRYWGSKRRLCAGDRDQRSWDRARWRGDAVWALQSAHARNPAAKCRDPPVNGGCGRRTPGASEARESHLSGVGAEERASAVTVTCVLNATPVVENADQRAVHVRKPVSALIRGGHSRVCAEQRVRVRTGLRTTEPTDQHALTVTGVGVRIRLRRTQPRRTLLR